MKFSEQRSDMMSLSFLLSRQALQHDFECGEAW